MDKAQRRAAINAYKERPLDWGVYAVRAPGGLVFVGPSRHLSTQQNSLWFALRTGGCVNRTLQAAWNDAGEERVVFEALEQLPADTPEFKRKDLLAERTAVWREALGAVAL